ncbi:SDR family oxidoreductase [Nocardioides sp. Leaf307]|uniref:SDR family oxidoreductase n=1 Tax=Nocardioides sp. Leaf307 TaxID=1736331 RepID=UPI0007026286|nr:SDR family oxidoreductase [Nocardioides sp. Leaf307]KQQ43833.1 oxidoreductase [Nocardioides sp. Leaf307]
MDLGLRDTVHLVTGGSRGLGRATAEVLLAEGARVVVSGRSQDSLDAALAAWRDADASIEGRVVGVAADNADADTPARLLDAARTAWGRVDGALISVGGPPKGAVTDIDDAQWTAAFGSVFLGAVRLAREVGVALPAGGALAMVLSSSVRQPLASMAVSNGLRPGLAMVAKTLADELGPRGVRVNGLLPGRVATDRLVELDAATGDPDRARAAAIASIPLGRQGEPAEFGRAAAWLLSPAASYVSGVMLPVDGGLLRTL